MPLCVTSLAHMLPDVRDVLEVSLEHGTFPDTGLPVPEILVLAGFLFIYTLEELMHMLLVWTGNIAQCLMTRTDHATSPFLFCITNAVFSANKSVFMFLSVIFTSEWCLHAKSSVIF